MEILRKSSYFLFATIFAISTVFFGGCSTDNPTEPTKTDESKVLLEYLEANGDFINTASPVVKAAGDVRTALLTDAEKTYIIDIRSAADFANGHIKAAVNIPFEQVLSHFKTINASNFNQIFIVCYTGQTSGYAVSILRLLGNSNVWSLKWGMSSWHTDFAGKWKSQLSNARASQFTNDNPAKPAAGNLPTINTGKSKAEDIMMARAEDLFAKGYNNVATITNEAVFQNPSNYFIVNYWTLAQYNEMGHIPGAVQYTPKADLKNNTFLKTLPTDKTIVLYCFTGQTSSFLAAFLRALGYDARSLMFGANAMIYDKMAASTGYVLFKDSEVFDYEYNK